MIGKSRGTAGRSRRSWSRLSRGCLWRWRRNPLRRHGDVVEAWIVLAVWALALVGGALAGWAAGGAVDQRFADRRAGVHAMAAELTENATDGSLIASGYDVGKAWVTVRWTAADGSAHTGRAKALPTATAGSRLQVWADRNERLVSAPPSIAESTFSAVMGGALAAQLTGTAVWGAGWLLRRRIFEQRLADWDAEWQRVGPQWRNLSGGKG
ncbi:hypothetical protein [Streptomyces sp. NPDC048277]|uniref:Rv1733c family protein n=1 Tax=Streptomyces sp. NPDC048277 TaxID=3155027 RepID=UPI0033E63ABD